MKALLTTIALVLSFSNSQANTCGPNGNIYEILTCQLSETIGELGDSNSQIVTLDATNDLQVLNGRVVRGTISVSGYFGATKFLEIQLFNGLRGRSFDRLSFEMPKACGQSKKVYSGAGKSNSFNANTPSSWVLTCEVVREFDQD